MKVPSILMYSKRVILWDCQVQGFNLTAGIAFFSSRIGVKEFNLTDRDGNKFCRVRVPDIFYNRENNGRAQNRHLDIVKFY